MFVQNGIFYSFAVNNKDPSKSVFGDEVFYENANNDLKSVKAIENKVEKFTPAQKSL